MTGNSEKITKRSSKNLAIFIDGVNLDRATRRLQKKIDLKKFFTALTAGIEPQLARYYIIVPKEDDSRHRSYLEAVEKAGMEVFVKRLPPKGVEVQVDTNIEMVTDILAFIFGAKEHIRLEGVAAKQSDSIARMVERGIIPTLSKINAAINLNPINEGTTESNPDKLANPKDCLIKVICPSPELLYSIKVLRHIGVEVIAADFGRALSRDLQTTTSDWLDLASSKTIWKE